MEPTGYLGRIKRVTVGAEQGIGWTLSSIRLKKRAYILPDDLSLLRDLKDPSRLSFANQRVSVVQSLGATDDSTVKGV